MRKLIIEDDEGKTVVVPLIRDEITVGRQEGNTIRLTDQNISRRHARLFRENGQLLIEDLKSYNGIKVNGAKISGRQALKDGDEITIGDYKLSIQTEKTDHTIGYDAGTPLAQPNTGAAPNTVATVKETAAVLAPAAAPPPAAALDGAPTIPVRTLAAQTAGNTTGEDPARLVVVSNLLAGQEFFIDRPSLVIGRTPENDVVLDHKSISRHHAKIIRDGNQYIIVDLESANGVRINGRPEERIALDGGDIIELGHVSLRFLHAGAVDPALLSLRGGKSKAKWLVMTGVAAAVAVAGVWMMDDANKPPRTTATVAVAQDPASIPPGAATDDPAPAISTTQTADPSVKTASDHLNEAAALLEKQDWDGAIFAARQAAQADPSSTRVQELVRQIETDRTGAENLALLKAEAEGGNLQQARAAAAAIPHGSRFKRDVPVLLEQAEKQFLTQHLTAAQELAAAGDCEQAQVEATLVQEIAPKNAVAKNVLALCRKAARRATLVRESKAAPSEKPERVERTIRPKPVAAAAHDDDDEDDGPVGNADDYIKAAQDAWLRGQYAAAIEESRKALQIRPGLMRAYQIIAVCSCALRDKLGATRAYLRLDERNRDLVKALCQKNDVSFD